MAVGDIGKGAGWSTTDIASSAVNATGNIANAVVDTMNQMNNLATQLDQGKISQAQFQAQMLALQLTMDMLKKLMDAVNQAANSFYNPQG